MSFFAMSSTSEDSLKIVGSVAGLVSTVTGDTHAMGNIDVGPASGDKKIILGITWADPIAFVITALTVGGVSLTEQVTVIDNGALDVNAAIFSADISSINGSQAISVTFNNPVQSVGASAIALSGLDSITADNSDSDTASTTLTITNLAAPKGGVAFAVGSNERHDNSSTWSTLTEQADLQTGSDGSNDHRHTSAWDLGERAAANETVTWGASDTSAAVGAGFR